MSPWGPGSDKIDELLEKNLLKRVVGADVGTKALMERAHQLLESANDLLEKDPVTAYTVAYDGAKHAAAAVLAEQNLRAADHVTIEKALTAQFGGLFSKYDYLRRRRNDLDYPLTGEDFADSTETAKAIQDAGEIIADAAKLIEQGILTTY